MDPSQEEDEFYMDDQPDIKRRQDNFNSSHLFGTKPWKSALYKKARSISRFAEDNVLGLDSDSNTPFSTATFKWKNIIYSLCFGWIIALVYCVVGFLLILISLNTSPFIPLVFKLSKYNLYPFKYRIERIVRQPIRSQDADVNDSTPLLHTAPISASAWHIISYSLLISIFVFPFHMLSWLLCYTSVYYIPMAKLSTKLMKNILKQPLLLNIKSLGRDDASRLLSHSDNVLIYSPETGNESTVLITSIHIAADVKYFKYTVDGINIMFINLIPVVLFTLINGYVLGPNSGFPPGSLTSRTAIFFLCIFSSIPLSYFLGLGIASISAQSSFGFGAVVNASFGSIIEILLYCVALTNKKGRIVEGAFIGSFLAVLLLLPGLSMIFGGLYYKELKFNVKSTGVTTTMLIMSIITLFTPTVYNISYGHDKFDKFYYTTVRPLAWICAIVMPTAYAIGLLFTLKTHVKHIYELNYQVHADDTSDNIIPNLTLTPSPSDLNVTNTDTLTLPSSRPRARTTSISVHGDNIHDAPNWSRSKSIAIIITCTVLFSFIAELLVDCVDVVTNGSGLSQKFIGVTLFALVPSVPEFVNAISFAIGGHVDLSLEIGLAYTVQVALLQIPCLVLFSALRLYVTNEEQTKYNSFP